ncbi:MAG: hydrolase [Chloroflexales bacterium]
MSEQDSQTLIGAIAGCLIGTRLDVDRAAVEKLLNDALVKPPEHPSREDVNRLQRWVINLLGKDGDQIDLIYGGATKIKGYVFEADRLPEIRGASALLDYVGIIKVKEICGKDRVIYAGGGSFLAVAPKNEGATLAAQIEQAFTDQTQTALSVVVAETFHLIELRFGRVTFTDAGLVGWWLEEFQKAYRDPALRPQLENYYYEVDEKTPGARFYNRKTFGEVVTLLTTMYHRRRDERAANGETRYLPIIERLPHTTRCASSDHRPALIEADAYGTSTSVSEASARKLVVGLTVKRDGGRKAGHLADQIGWHSPQVTSWETHWQKYLDKEGADTPYGKHPDARQADPAFDIQQIGAAGNGFIGMIYADGNNVGRELAKLKTPQAYADFSKKLEDAAQGAVFAALATHLLPMTVSGDVIHPFEILTIGGDDLILIVPGTQALNIALTIGKEFELALRDKEKGGRSRVGRYTCLNTPDVANTDHAQHDTHATDFDVYTPKIGLSVGVVVAKDDAPIFFLRLLAEELLKTAKKKARDEECKRKKANIQPPEQQTAGGAVDFMVMKSITMVTDKIEGFRKEALDGKQCRLTARVMLRMPACSFRKPPWRSWSIGLVRR